MRRLVWFLFAPILLVGGLVVLLVAGFSKALSFGALDRYALEGELAAMVLWAALAAAALAAAASWLLRLRHEASTSARVLDELASMLLGVFFGGLLAIAHALGIWYAYVPALAPALAWAALVEARRPLRTRRRRASRLVAWAFIPAATAAVIHYAAFS